jgi:cytochrome c-type biogenesis protein CcmH/NrfF
MQFSISIDCDNAAFKDDAHSEIARILRVVATKLEQGQTEGTCMDYNGNRVGEFDINS